MNRTIELELKNKGMTIAEAARRCPDFSYAKVRRILLGQSADPEDLRYIYLNTGIDANAWAGIANPNTSN